MSVNAASSVMALDASTPIIGTGITINPATGGFVLDQTTHSIDIQEFINALAGSMSLLGSAPELSYGVSLFATVSNLLQDQTISSVSVGALIDALAGALVLESSAPNFSFGTTIDALLADSLLPITAPAISGGALIDALSGMLSFPALSPAAHYGMTINPTTAGLTASQATHELLVGLIVVDAIVGMLNTEVTTVDTHFGMVIEPSLANMAQNVVLPVIQSGIMISTTAGVSLLLTTAPEIVIIFGAMSIEATPGLMSLLQTLSDITSIPISIVTPSRGLVGSGFRGRGRVSQPRRARSSVRTGTQVGVVVSPGNEGNVTG
jgi:hypothetical protein